MNMLKTIETENLLIKPISLDYQEDFFEEYDKEIAKFIYPKPFDKEGLISYIQKSIDKNNSGESFVGVVLNKETEEFLGMVEVEGINTKTPDLNLWIKRCSKQRLRKRGFNCY